MPRPTADADESGEVAHREVDRQMAHRRAGKHVLQRHLAGAATQFEERHGTQAKPEDPASSCVAREVIGRNGRPGEDEMAPSGMRVDRVPDVVPDHGGGLPLVDQAGSRPFEHQVGIDRDHVVGSPVHVQKDPARSLLPGRHRLATGPRALDQDGPGRYQAPGQFPVGHAAGIALDSSCHGRTVAGYRHVFDAAINMISMKMETDFHRNQEQISAGAHGPELARQKRMTADALLWTVCGSGEAGSADRPRLPPGSPLPRAARSGGTEFPQQPVPDPREWRGDRHRPSRDAERPVGEAGVGPPPAR